MNLRQVLACGSLLVALVVASSVAALDTATGWGAAPFAAWPVLGLAVGMFIVAPQRLRGWIFAVQSVAIGGSLALSDDLTWLGGLAGSMVVTLPAVLAAAGLGSTSAAGRRYRQDEVDAYHGVTALAGLLCGALSVVLLATTDASDPGQLALAGLAAFVAATTSQLVVLPFCLDFSGGITWRSAELWAQRTMLTVFAAGIFLPEAAAPLAFMMFPIIAWAAIRAQTAETHLQVLLLSVVVGAATFTGRGPFAIGDGGGADQVSALVVHLYLASICYLLVPLTSTVRRLLVVSRQASRAATTVNRMLDSATGTVFMATDPQGILTHCNSGAEQALGHPATDLLGRSTAHLHSEAEVQRQASHFGVSREDTEAAYRAAVAAQVASGGRRDWEVTRADGQRRMLSLSISEMTEPNGRVVGYIASGEDITERLRAESALEKAFVNERASTQALREADRVKQDLISTVSHELRTPITSITGFTELLAQGDLGPLTVPQLEAVHRIDRNGVRLKDLVEDLLLLSTAEAGSVQLTATDLDLAEVVHRAHEAVGRLLDQRQLEVVLRMPGTPVIVRGEAKVLERALINLMSNAVKFTPDGGTVEVSVSRRSPGAPDGRGIATVSDTGIGIAPDEQRAVFERFYRTATAGERAIQGTGLGLSIVQSIAEQHSGEVTLQSAPGAGTTITFAVPLAEGPASSPPTPSRGSTASADPRDARSPTDDATLAGGPRHT